MARVVVLDGHCTSYRVIKHLLGRNHCVDHYEYTARAVDYVREHEPDVVFLNVDDGACDAMDLIGQISLKVGSSPVIALMDTVELRRVVDAVHRGACDVVAQPMRIRDLQLAVTRALARQQCRVVSQARVSIPEIVGLSPAMARVREEVQRVASNPGPVIITGESGVGKEVVARAVHNLSNAASGPFEARNCGALPETLFEAEVFGTERGAYTDAVPRAGAFELADGGTLFLDEIGELTQTAQVKLLRVLETGQYHRVGGTRLRRTTARIVVATNSDLRALVQGGSFRSDLFYRIDVFRIAIPPLRERREDIPLLTRHFQELLTRDGVESRAEGFSPNALERLSEYRWPGNVRELRNVVWRALVDAGGPVIEASELSLG